MPDVPDIDGAGEEGGGGGGATAGDGMPAVPDWDSTSETGDQGLPCLAAAVLFFRLSLRLRVAGVSPPLLLRSLAPRGPPRGLRTACLSSAWAPFVLSLRARVLLCGSERHPHHEHGRGGHRDAHHEEARDLRRAGAHHVCVVRMRMRVLVRMTSDVQVESEIHGLETQLAHTHTLLQDAHVKCAREQAILTPAHERGRLPTARGGGGRHGGGRGAGGHPGRKPGWLLAQRAHLFRCASSRSSRLSVLVHQSLAESSALVP